MRRYDFIYVACRYRFPRFSGKMLRQRPKIKAVPRRFVLAKAVKLPGTLMAAILILGRTSSLQALRS